MGCFNLKGCISQLPIEYGDRVAGIICKITSGLNYYDCINYVQDYLPIPACPIIWGKYDEYGGITPDEGSKTVKILENFFNKPFDDINDALSRITSHSTLDESVEVLKPLIELRQSPDVYTKKIVRGTPFYKSDEHILENNWCLLLEHESVIKEFIKWSDKYIEESFFPQYRKGSWDKQYQEQLEYIKEYKLDEWNSQVNWDISPMNKLKEYPEIFFPINTYYMSFQAMMHSSDMMDLFRNYPSLHKHAFDPELKDEYLDTLRFYFVMKTCRMRMFIDSDYGYQWQNNEVIKGIVNTYKEIMDGKETEEF